MPDDIPFEEPPELDPKDYPFNDVFLQQVAGPWQEECLKADHPWEATPALRKHWVEMAKSSKPEIMESGIVALSRCARQTAEERGLVSAVITGRHAFESVIFGAAIDFMLSGASPHPGIYPAYWGACKPEEICGNRFLAEMTSLWSRHPACLPYVEPLSSQLMHGENHFGWGVNPLISDAALQGLARLGSETEWLPATAAFTSLDDSTERIEECVSPLEIFSTCLRPHLTSDQWDAVISVGLEPDLSFAFLDHPVGRGNPCPQVRDWLNPHRDLIEYAEGANTLGTIWRYWMPTLSYPWFREVTDKIRELPILLALTLMGKPYSVLLEAARAEGNLWFEKMALTNTTYLLEQIRLNQEKPDESATV